MKPIKNPFHATKDPINHDIYERFIQVFDFHSIASQIHEEVVGRVTRSIASMDADLLLDFKKVHKNLVLDIKRMENLCSTIEDKLGKLFESSSLTEDVYKLRDEMKEINKKLYKVNANFKNFYKMSEIMNGQDKE